MSIQIEIRIDAEKARRAFATAPQELGKNLSIAIVKSAFTVERESKLVTPVDTGRLRASIDTMIKPLMAIIAPHTNYAIFVHEGTRFMKGRPFMETGVRTAEGRIQGFFEKAVDDTLDSIERKAS